MCFTAIVVSNKEDKDLVSQIFLSLYLNNAVTNKDGAAYRNADKVIRTLDYGKFFKEIYPLDHTGLSHLHLRLATSAVKKEFIHLWNIGGAYCAHNGVLAEYPEATDLDTSKKIYSTSEYSDPLPGSSNAINYESQQSSLWNNNYHNSCDSIEFFTSIKDAIASKDIRAIAREVKNWKGYAVATISYPDNEFIVVSYNKRFLASLINERVIVFSSDEINIRREFFLQKEKVKRFKGHSFKQIETFRKVFYSGEIETYTTSYYNVVMHCAPDGSPIKQVKIKEINSYTEDDYDYEEF